MNHLTTKSGDIFSKANYCDVELDNDSLESIIAYVDKKGGENNQRDFNDDESISPIKLKPYSETKANRTSK